MQDAHPQVHHSAVQVRDMSCTTKGVERLFTCRATFLYQWARPRTTYVPHHTGINHDYIVERSSLGGTVVGNARRASALAAKEPKWE